MHSEVVNDASGFPVPPFTSFTAPIAVGETLNTTVTIDFDGLSLAKMDIKTGGTAPSAPPPPPPPSAAAPAGPPPGGVSPSR